MPGEVGVTNEELARRLEGLRGSLRDDLGDIKAQLALLVPRELYDAHRTALYERILGVERRLDAAEKADEKQDEGRRTTNRYVWSAVIVPIVALLVQILLAARSVRP